MLLSMVMTMMTMTMMTIIRFIIITMFNIFTVNINFLIRTVGGGVQTGSTWHVGH
jgi:hypothetical protein